MIAPPFRLYTWDKPFLPALLHDIRTITHDNLGRAVLIMPHNRPRRHLLELIRNAQDLPRPLLLPRMVTLQELVAEYRTHSTQSPLHTAMLLDRVALLHTCVRSLSATNSDIPKQLRHLEIPDFLPWGIRLASLMEECFTHGIQAINLYHMEDEVPAFANDLLSILGDIQRQYVEQLRQHNWTTPGFDIQEAAAHAADIPPLYRPSPFRHVFIAGFSVLGEGERKIFRALWEAGAHICLHTDIRMAQDKGAHWAAAAHAAWRKDWHAATVETTSPTPENQPSMAFCEGHDLHSQLECLREDLSSRPAGSTAIVLTDNAQLLPVLHHLPDKDVNISMGYPLSRSPLFRLIDSLLQLHRTRQADSLLPWRPLLECLRHPYLTMLHAHMPNGEEQALREAIRILEKTIRKGQRRVDLDALFSTCRAQIAVELCPLLDALQQTAFLTPGTCHSLNDMADWLQELTDMLLTYGGAIWTRFPLDAECLYRLARHIIPTLRQSSLASEIFPFPLLCQFTTELLQAERVPFEVDPITGVQVMGMLETRMLDFENIYILDATDNALPGSPAPDPLLPDALRSLLGLPDAHHREMVSAYTFTRLISCARRVSFYWQEGVLHSTLFDGKKNRSRFVEQYIWELEQQRGTLLRPGEAPLRKSSCVVQAVNHSRHSLKVTSTLHDAMRLCLSRQLSATLLDHYLRCPLQFAWQHLCKLNVPENVCEGDDPPAVGELIHAVLYELYSPWRGKLVQRGDITQDMLEAVFYKQLQVSNLRKSLPISSYMMLKHAGPLRLKTFLEQQPQETFIFQLEQEYTADLGVCGVPRSIYGKLDRVDMRDGYLHVLDYKTGAVTLPDVTLWSDTALWEEVGAFCRGEQTDPDGILLQTVATRLHSVQLPCYLYVLQHNNSLPVGNAALVSLKKDGTECQLFPEDISSAELDTMLRLRVPDLLTFLIYHMEKATNYVPLEMGKNCTYCKYSSLCML